eukprot:COSAG01_NODE_19972_length_978_cov_40.249147_1_plen_83_part_10
MYVLAKQALQATFITFPKVEKKMRARMVELAAELTDSDMHRLDLQQWLNARDLGSYTPAIINSFTEAEYGPEEWLPELEAMAK